MSDPARLLAHDDVGEGDRVVVFVHAFPLDRRMWRAQIDAVRAESARAIAVDLAGFGGSREIAPCSSIDANADDVAALLDARGVARATLVGLSMGGYVAIAFARRHGARLDGLVLADTKATADDDAARAARDVNAAKARGHGAEALIDGMLPRLLSAHASKSMLDEVRAMGASQPIESLAAALLAMRDRADATSQLSAITVPTAVVVGEDDLVTPRRDADALCGGIRSAKLTVIPRAGHLSNVEQPIAFAAAIAALLRT